MSEAWLGVLLALAGGLASLAYRHRPFFRSVNVGLYVLALAAFIAAAVWNIAVIHVQTEILRLRLEPITTDAIRSATERVSLPIGWLFGGFIALHIFLMFLNRMPTHADDVAPPAATKPPETP